MIKIAHVKETENLNLSQEVVSVIKEIAVILDTEYGEERDVDGGDGGYILVIESEEEFEDLEDIYINIEDVIPEYVDIINVEGDENYTNSLILLNNDFSVSLVMKESLLPSNLKEYISN